MVDVRELEAEVRRDVERIFEEKRRRLGVEARLDLGFLDHAPIVGKSVYGEAFPFERPPRVHIEVFAPDATTREITEIVCEELLHIRHPEISEEEIAKMVSECVGVGSEEKRTKDILRRQVSEEAKTLLRERVGYRCTEFRGSGVTRATDVIRFEVDELGNEHILDELRGVLGLPGSATLEQSLSAIRDRFGEGSRAIWLGTREAVKELYCGEGEEPIAVVIPENAVLVSDLGYDGQLFLFPKRIGRDSEEERGRDILRRAGYP